MKQFETRIECLYKVTTAQELSGHFASIQTAGKAEKERGGIELRQRQTEKVLQRNRATKKIKKVGVFRRLTLA